MKLDLTNFHINTKNSKFIKELVCYYNGHNINSYLFTVIVIGNGFNLYKLKVKKISKFNNNNNYIDLDIYIKEKDIINWIVKYYDNNTIKDTLVFEAYGYINNYNNEDNKIFLSSMSPLKINNNFESNFEKDKIEDRIKDKIIDNQNNIYIIEDIIVSNSKQYTDKIILNEYLYYKKIDNIKKNEI